MTYRQFLIYLNAIGIRNEEIEKIENYINDYSVNYNKIFEEDVLIDERTGFSPNLIKKLKLKNKNALFDLHKLCERENIEVITSCDDEYPQRLKYIENYPRVLYVKGCLKEIDSVSISIVGARKHTSYGQSTLNYFVDELSKSNVTVVSGMAYGIDGLAHERALKNNIRTIAVLGNGVDEIYPKKHTNLYREIIENGAVISEYPPGTKALPYRFPERNRIISGLSLATIVVEAERKSGSLITARLAAQQGREVFSIPGNIDSIYSEGTNMLIRDGAIPLLSINDIYDIFPELEKNIINLNKENAELGEEELKILNAISEGAINIDSIADKLGEDISYISSLITILELKNIIEVSDKIRLKL